MARQKPCLTDVFSHDDVVLQGFLFGTVPRIVHPRLLEIISEAQCFPKKRYCRVTLLVMEILIDAVGTTNLVVRPQMYVIRDRLRVDSRETYGPRTKKPLTFVAIGIDLDF